MLAAAARADLYLFHVTEGRLDPLVEPGRRFREPRRRHRRGIRPAVRPARRRASRGCCARPRRTTRPASSRTPRKETAAPSASSSRRRATRSGCATRPSVEIRKDIARAAASPKDMLRTQSAYGDLPLRSAGHTSRTRGQRRGQDRRAVRSARCRNRDQGSQRRALRREEHAQETVDGAAGGSQPAAGDGGARRAAGHLSRARRRGRRGRPRRDDGLRAEGGSAARRSAQAEHAGARHAAAGRRVRAAPGLRQRAGGDRAARNLRRAQRRAP